MIHAYLVGLIVFHGGEGFPDATVDQLLRQIFAALIVSNEQMICCNLRDDLLRDDRHAGIVTPSQIFSNLRWVQSQIGIEDITDISPGPP